MDQAGWHTSSQVEVPEVFIWVHAFPFTELQPAERLASNQWSGRRISYSRRWWLGRVLFQRCRALLKQQRLDSGPDCFHWWPLVAALNYGPINQFDITSPHRNLSKLATCDRDFCYCPFNHLLLQMLRIPKQLLRPTGNLDISNRYNWVSSFLPWFMPPYKHRNSSSYPFSTPRPHDQTRLPFTFEANHGIISTCCSRIKLLRFSRWISVCNFSSFREYHLIVEQQL